MAPHELALLDTSVVIEPPSDLAALARRIAVSTVTVAELATGLQSSRDPVQRVRRQERFERILSTYAPIPYDVGAARLYGALCDAVRASGRNPRPRRMDLLIASVAAHLGIPLITRNPDNFAGIHEVVHTVAVPPTP